MRSLVRMRHALCALVRGTTHSGRAAREAVNSLPQARDIHHSTGKFSLSTAHRPSNRVPYNVRHEADVHLYVLTQMHRYTKGYRGPLAPTTHSHPDDETAYIRPDARRAGGAPRLPEHKTLPITTTAMQRIRAPPVPLAAICLCRMSPVH